MENKKGIFPPTGGWEPRTFYIVEVSFFHGNIIHEAIFYTGCLNNEKNPINSYNKIITSSYNKKLADAYYLSVKSKLAYYSGNAICKAE